MSDLRVTKEAVQQGQAGGGGGRGLLVSTVSVTDTRPVVRKRYAQSDVAGPAAHVPQHIQSYVTLVTITLSTESHRRAVGTHAS
jgi:hypothetical protein